MHGVRGEQSRMVDTSLHVEKVKESIMDSPVELPA